MFQPSPFPPSARACPQNVPDVHSDMHTFVEVVPPLYCTGVWIEAHVQAILGQYGVCVLPRDGDDVTALINSHPLLAAHRANVRVAPEAVGFAVSSTLIRDVVRAGKSARYLTPDPVLTYIHKNRLWSKY
jgi:nicotinamide mononucleotide adenylyltransferase